jgi:F-type H+-transporting ATPase subunit delta
MVGADKIATVYAQSLVELAREGSALEGIAEEMDSVTGAFTSDPKIWKYFRSPIIHGDDKLVIIKKAFKPLVSPLIFNFIAILAKNKRIDHLPGINESFKLLLDREFGRRRFQVTTAVSMEAVLQAELQKALTARFKAEAVLELKIEPDIIGGVVVESEDIMKNMINCNISGEGFYEN